jgi:hypothetical protein
MIRLACHLDTYFHRGGQGLISSVGSFSTVGANFHCRGSRLVVLDFFCGVPDSFRFHDSFLIRSVFMIRS